MYACVCVDTKCRGGGGHACACGDGVSMMCFPPLLSALLTEAGPLPPPHLSLNLELTRMPCPCSHCWGYRKATKPTCLAFMWGQWIGTPPQASKVSTLPLSHHPISPASTKDKFLYLLSPTQRKS